MADTSMVKVKVNAGGVGYTLPNPVPNQPPINAAAYRGQVVEMPADEAARLKAARIRVFYDDPVTGVRLGAFREEPSVVDATEGEAADLDAHEAARQRVRDLEDQLAEARNALPLTQDAAAVVSPLTAAVAASGPRELPALDDAPRPVTDADTAKASGKAPATGGK